MGEPQRTLRPRDFRMPAEWEPHEAVWLAWPSEEMRLYPGYHVKLESTWLAMTRAMQPHVEVRILVENEPARERLEAQFAAFGIEAKNVKIYVMPIDDVWVRDNGPIFVVDDSGQVAATKWGFNGYGERAPYERDGQVPERIAERLGLPVLEAPLITEGGAIEVDGAGSFMATQSSILNGNRTPNIEQEAAERVLGEYLGVRHFIWLSGAPPKDCESLGDGTDYHVDIDARYSPQRAILYCSPDDENDPRYPYLRRHREELQNATDAQGRPFSLVALPTPQMFSVSPQSWEGETRACGSITDAAYTNYLVTNGVVLVPVYGLKEDERAKAVLAEHFPDREVIGIPTLTLTEEGGAVHCVTQQQPRGALVHESRARGDPVPRSSLCVW